MRDAGPGKFLPFKEHRCFAVNFLLWWPLHREVRDSNLEFRDGNYFVTLPWHREALRDVPSNFQLANTIAYKVAQRNISQNLEEAYNRAFADQLARGIISEILLDQINPSDCIWIPHRPVVKTDPLTTMKVRPVFNCSLKVRGKPSLNEAAFPGIDIMAKLLIF